MKKLFLLVSLLFLGWMTVYSQDTITRVTGEKIACKVTNADNKNYYYKTLENGHQIGHYINKKEVAYIKYGAPFYPSKPNYPASNEISSTKAGEPTLTAPGETERSSIGFGGGYDFGGLGASLLLYPQKNIGFFGGLGFALAGVGFNAGVKLRYVPMKADAVVHPFVIGMYGYNAAIYISGAETLNKVFSGFTAGAGIDLHLHGSRKGYWSAAVLVPFRTSGVNNYINDLLNNYNIVWTRKLIPIGVSAGYHMVFK